MKLRRFGLKVLIELYLFIFMLLSVLIQILDILNQFSLIPRLQNI